MTRTARVASPRCITARQHPAGTKTDRLTNDPTKLNQFHPVSPLQIPRNLPHVVRSRRVDGLHLRHEQRPRRRRRRGEGRRVGRRGRRRLRRRRRRGGRHRRAVAAAGPPGQSRVGAAGGGVGALPARLPHHGLQRARRLEAVRPLRGVQVHRRGRAARVRLHHPAAGAARRQAHRRPGPAAQGRPARRLRRRPGDGVPSHVRAVRGGPDHEPHARGRGQRLHRLVRRLHQHGLLRLRLPRALRSHLRFQALQADIHMSYSRWLGLLPLDRIAARASYPSRHCIF